MPTNTPALAFRGYPTLGNNPTRAYISNKQITSNLATITTSAAHGITQVGTLVTIQGVDSTFDGTWVIQSIPTGSTFTFVSTTATVASAAVSPVGVATFAGFAGAWTGFTVTNKVVQNTIATLTTSSAHGLSVGDLVAVTIGDTIYDGTQIQVIATPTTTTFSYIVSTTTAASTAVTQGAFGKFPAAYTVPAATNTIVTNVIVSNNTAASATFTLVEDAVPLAFQQTIAANSSAYFDLKQYAGTAKTITASASSPRIGLHISGMAVS